MLILCLVLAFLAFQACPAQTPAPDTTYRYILSLPPDPGPADLLLPAFLRQGYSCRAWVRDILPARTDSLDDITRVDMIWLRALYLTDGDRGRALCVATIAVFEHRTIPLKFGVNLPLTMESDSAFAKRYRNLPSVLFADKLGGNDCDKLQHFFASAWLAYCMDNNLIPDALGWMVESGEAAFVKSSVADLRDIRANRLGHLFARLLWQYPEAVPGDILRAWNRQYLASGHP